LLIGLLLLTLLPACHPAPAPVPADDYAWDLPAHFPTPYVPTDNPMSDEKVALGRHLFYDKRLSVNEQMSCATCHQQELAFTDGLPRAIGTTGERHPRGAMSLANVAYASRLAWANPLLDRLEHQALLPMFGEAPVEMGLAGHEQELLARLEADPRYVAMFDAAFPADGAVTLDHITQALASFERTLISGDSPYDRYLQGDEAALSPAAKRGLNLFLSERLECFHCHGSFNLSDSVDHGGMVSAAVAFHNTGLYNLDGKGAYPAENTGVYELTGDPADMGRFKAPTLRNIAVTAPYMHDGSVATLEEAIAHYAAGGRTVANGPYRGDGSTSPLRSEFVAGFILEPEEEKDLVAFLESLTDETFLHDPRFSDPFEAE
jgi:cytochrome c peroxidase